MSKGDRVSISLVGGPPWGFRLGGGSDFECPLEIAKLRKRSKAFEAGLAEGDVVTVIDHQDVSSKSHGDAMKIIELAGPTLKLEIIKGVGPSADLMSSSLMSASQIDGTMSQSFIEQIPAQATVVVSREPSVSRSISDRPRERSSSRSRTLTIITGNKQVDAKPVPVKPAHLPQNEPWTVDVTSYQFANANHLPPSEPVKSIVPPPAPKQPPPLSPKPKFKANTLPRTAGNPNSFSFIPAAREPSPARPSYQPSVAGPQAVASSSNASPQSNTPMFKVAKVDGRANKWQPTSIQNVEFHHPKHQFNSGVMSPAPPQPAMSQSVYSSNLSSALSPVSQQQYSPHQLQYNHQNLTNQNQPQYNQSQISSMIENNHSPDSLLSPHSVSYNNNYIPEPPPPPPPMMSPPTSSKPANHIPGMVNPLICDDSQGDFGANPLVRPDTVDGQDLGKSKKMYSDSAFYDSPLMSYPTIQEQVAMAKEISSFLESNQNKRSRGGRMFSKRKQRAEDWVLNSQGQRRDTQITSNYDSLDSGLPKFAMQRKEFGYNQVRHHPDPIKSKISAAELEQIQHNQDSLCKHDNLPPNIAFDINQALAHSHGRAGQFFERRRQRAEKYVVDENNRRQWQPQNPNLQVQIEQPTYTSPAVHKPYKSPWEAAIEGRLDSAFSDDVRSQQATTHNGYMPQQQPLNIITNQQQNAQPQLNVKYKTFKPVKPAFNAFDGSTGSHTLPKPRTRLDMMLEQGVADQASSRLAQQQQPTVGSIAGYNNHNSAGVTQIPMSRSYGQQPAPSQSVYSPVQQTQYASASLLQPGQSSFSAMNLRRPKDYVGNGGMQVTNNFQPTSVSYF